MKMITFLDHEGYEIAVRSILIESVCSPKIGQNHGGLTLTSGRWHSFNSDSTAPRIIEELIQDTEA